MVPLHPIAGPVPETVRWQMPTGTLPVVGPAVAVPPALGSLRADGTVAFVVVGCDHVEVTLEPGRTWSRDGAVVRTALLSALEAPDEWRTTAASGHPDEQGPAAPVASDDEALREAAETLVHGEVGDLARSHGGAIELDSVADGVVTVRMRGACSGCPAAGLTLHARLEQDLRATFPELREVRALDPEPRALGTTVLGLLRRRDQG